MKKRLRHSWFPVNFAKPLRILFSRTPSSDYLCRPWRKIVRDTLASLLMTDLKEC